MSALLVALFLSQSPAPMPPGSGGRQMTDEQKCQQECGKKILDCQMPCMPKTPQEADKPEVRKKFMACATDCAKKQKPCMDSCGTKKKKKAEGE